MSLAELAPSELLPGDVILVRCAWARVLEEAMTMHRGLGMFDEFQILVGTRIEFLDHPGPQLWSWGADDHVLVRRAGDPPRTLRSE